MNAVRQITGVDLRNTSHKSSQWSAMVTFADHRLNVDSTSFFCNFRGVVTNRGVLVAIVVNQADVMSPHSIDIPPWEIEKIEFQIGEISTFFNSMDEGSYYFHVCAKDDYHKVKRMLIYLRSGFQREKCNIVWRCYYLNRNPRDLMLENKSLLIPVAKNIVYDGQKFSKRPMAKL